MAVGKEKKKWMIPNVPAQSNRYNAIQDIFIYKAHTHAPCVWTLLTIESNSKKRTKKSSFVQLSLHFFNELQQKMPGSASTAC